MTEAGPDNDLNIQHQRQNGRGRYWARVSGGEAELTYILRDDGVMIIDHTFTPPQARGQSIARKLVEHVIAEARKDGFLIDPQCSYVDKLFQRRAEWAPLRA